MTQVLETKGQQTSFYEDGDGDVTVQRRYDVCGHQGSGWVWVTYENGHASTRASSAG